MFPEACIVSERDRWCQNRLIHMNRETSCIAQTPAIQNILEYRLFMEDKRVQPANA